MSTTKTPADGLVEEMQREAREPGISASDEFKKVAKVIYDLVHGLASEIVGRGEFHIPMIIIFSEDGERMLAIHELDMSSPASKNKAAHVAKMMAVLGISVTIMESWMVRFDKGDKKTIEEVRKETKALYDKYGDMAHMPDHMRGEMIVFTIQKGRECLMSLCEIDRKTSTLKKEDLIDPMDGMAEGRFVRDKKFTS